jgi:thiamine-triphosphatase
MAIKRLIEVERKFCSTGPATILVGGHPPFQSLAYHGSRKFTDKYFDRGQLLRSAGIYIRQRDNCWEAKVKKGGDYINSQFEETICVSKITAYAHNIAGVQGRLSSKNNFLLDKVADFKTTRYSWTANGKFKIVVDTTDFGHTVGEVELDGEVNTRAELKNDLKCLAEMDQEIVDFMKMYPWAFPPGEPKGKLSAYFEQHGNMHDIPGTQELLVS